MVLVQLNLVVFEINSLQLAECFREMQLAGFRQDNSDTLNGLARLVSHLCDGPAVATVLAFVAGTWSRVEYFLFDDLFNHIC